MPMVTYDVALLDYTRQIRQQILKLYKSGVPVAKIASQLHLGQTSTYRHLKAMGIKLSPRKRNTKGQYIRS
jgi:DNA invertase Pin-like site-specific DNA recombinase